MAIAHGRVTRRGDATIRDIWAPMLWIALAFVVAMMIGFLMPRKPLSLNLNAKKPLPPAPKDPFAAPAGSPKTDDVTK